MTKSQNLEIESLASIKTPKFMKKVQLEKNENQNKQNDQIQDQNKIKQSNWARIIFNSQN